MAKKVKKGSMGNMKCANCGYSHKGSCPDVAKG